MKRPRRLLLAAAAFAGLLVLAALPASGASTPKAAATASTAAAGGLITHEVSAAEQAATIRYWTPERMRTAKPADVLTVKQGPQIGRAAPSASGPAQAVAPVDPTTGAGGGPTASPAASPTPTGFSYPAPFTRFAVGPTSLYTKYPWAVNGKVFFTNNGVNYVCSGTSVTTPNRSVLWTAGHCVANTDGTHKFDSFFEFVPAYNGNATNCCPKGVWVADNLVTTTDWLNNGDFSRDMGAAHVPINSSTGKTLGATVGSAGFAWNQARDQEFVDFGYPQASPFNGTSLVECNAAHAFDDTGIGGSGPPPLAIGCDMTGGSSGGSWQIRWGGNTTVNTQKLQAGLINGHNDYKYGSQPLAMYSPYFDNLANAVRCSFGGSGC